jgi:hypothetical protein
MTYKILSILTSPFDSSTQVVQISTYKMFSYFKSQSHGTKVFSYQKNGHDKQDVAKLYEAVETL